MALHNIYNGGLSGKPPCARSARVLKSGGRVLDRGRAPHQTIRRHPARCRPRCAVRPGGGGGESSGHPDRLRITFGSASIRLRDRRARWGCGVRRRRSNDLPQRTFQGLRLLHNLARRPGLLRLRRRRIAVESIGKKKPAVMRVSGSFADFGGFAWTVNWWRRRESNPRPKMLRPWIYMHSAPFSLVLRQHGVQSAPQDQPVKS